MPFPDHVSPVARDLVIKLLRRRPGKRLGCRSGTSQVGEILHHKFFRSLDLPKLMSMALPAPWVPDPLSAYELGQGTASVSSAGWQPPAGREVLAGDGDAMAASQQWWKDW